MKKNFYFTLLCSLLTVIAVAQGPVVYLPLDSDLKDASGNGNDAVDAGVIATTFVNDAVRGMVASFDTSDYAVLPKIDALRFGPGQDFAFALWVKIPRVGGDPAILGNKNWGSGRNKGFVVYNKNSDAPGASNIGINFCDGNTDSGGSGVRQYWTAFENGAPDVVDDTWHFFAASFDRTDTLRVWVDGVLQYSPCNLTQDPGYAYDDVNDYPFTIMEDGTGAYNAGSGLKGLIDELRVWNRSVSNDEMAALYDQTHTAVTPEIQTAIENAVVYPNPANGVAILKFNTKDMGSVNILTYNIMGKLVNSYTLATISGENITRMNIGGWAPGIYLVTIQSKTSTETVRLVISK